MAKRKHILLIVDDKEELGFFMDALKMIPGPIQCTYASSAEHAFEILTFVKPDFIFVDYHLPRINGLQFISILNLDSKLKEPKVFLYSTRINVEIEKMGKILGAAGSIKKTNSINTLIHQLKSILVPELLPRHVFLQQDEERRYLN